MRDNLPAAHGDFIALPDHRILALEGPDAARFAHAQFMSDVAGLPDGQWQWSGWLMPKGRVIALFALLRFDAQAIWLLLPDADPRELRDALQRFVFRSKVTLAVRDDRHVAGHFASPSRAAGSSMATDAPIELDAGTTQAPRTLRISGTPAPANAVAVDRWKTFDLRHGLPRLDPSQANAWTPQQLSLDRLHAYSVKKGCYPGQEIVARTHFLGQAKRGLVLFDAAGVAAPGADVVDGERAIGTVVSAATHEDGCIVLAVLPLDVDTAHLHAEGAALTPRPLLDGLAR
jgi:folate-binding protein YgfZ